MGTLRKEGRLAGVAFSEPELSNIGAVEKLKFSSRQPETEG